MPVDPRKRQKRLERRAAKRKEKKLAVRRREGAGLAPLLAAAGRGPVLHTLAADSLDDQGIGAVIISRELPDGRVAVASFLVDRYCLGIKDAYVEVMRRPAYSSDYLRQLQARTPAHNVEPADARKLVEQAVEFARSLGFSPHPDYAKAAILFGSINPADSSEEFHFGGADGLPTYIAGPHDTPARYRAILAALQRTCGNGNFHYLVGMRAAEMDSLPPGLDPVVVDPVDVIDEPSDN